MRKKIENYEIDGILHTLFIIQPIYGNCDYSHSAAVGSVSVGLGVLCSEERGKSDEWMRGKNVGKLLGVRNLNLRARKHLG